MYVCLSHSARREEAAAYWVLHGSLETMQGWLEWMIHRIGSVAPGQIRDGIIIVVLE